MSSCLFLKKLLFRGAPVVTLRSCCLKPVQITSYQHVTHHPFQLNPPEYSSSASTRIAPDAEVPTAPATAAAQRRVTAAPSAYRGPAPGLRPLAEGPVPSLRRTNGLRDPEEIAGGSKFKFAAQRTLRSSGRPRSRT